MIQIKPEPNYGEVGKKVLVVSLLVGVVRLGSSLSVHVAIVRR